MEGRIREEHITKAILKWLTENDWQIICFDFPQSGTGYVLHPNQSTRTTKNKGAIIPDIVAIKNKTCIFFENKDRFVLSDFEKINSLRTENDYSEAIEKLLKNYLIDNIYYGVGIPETVNTLKKSVENTKLTDFIIMVNNQNITINYQYEDIF